MTYPQDRYAEFSGAAFYIIIGLRIPSSVADDADNSKLGGE